MIVQPAVILTNQPHHHCHYSWYPSDQTDDTITTTSIEPHNGYIYNRIDKDLLEQKSVTSVCNNNNTSVELLQRYKQSVAPSDRAYHSTETIDDALTPPWALHYDIQRRAVTPNSTEMPIHEELPRRLKSAPIVRSLPPTTILHIPEPRFLTTIIPVSNPPPPPPPSSSKTRASSAKARLNTTIPSENKQQAHRVITSAQVPRQKKVEKKLTQEEIDDIFKRIYGDHIQEPEKIQPIEIIHVHPAPSSVPPPPVYIYEKSASWCGSEISSTPTRKSIEVKAIPLNPHYIHRPGVISIRNVEKNSVVRENSALRKSTKHYRRHHHSHGKRNEPLLALKPMSQKSRLSLEIDGVQLIHDPKLTLDDKSIHLNKYFIDGKLYLVKDKRYNVLENVNPSVLEKYNQTLKRSRYYQTDLHSTTPSRTHHCVNRMSLSKRPQTATVYT